MIYMVEMRLLDTARRTEWDAWYVAHQHRLLSIPGIHASQRFEAIHAAPSPFVALHEVDGPEVFTSDAYRAVAGPSNTGEWQSKMDNWHRNVFRGLAHTPDVRRRPPRHRRAGKRVGAVARCSAALDGIRQPGSQRVPPRDSPSCRRRRRTRSPARPAYAC